MAASRSLFPPKLDPSSRCTSPACWKRRWSGSSNRSSEILPADHPARGQCRTERSRPLVRGARTRSWAGILAGLSSGDEHASTQPPNLPDRRRRGPARAAPALPLPTDLLPAKPLRVAGRATRRPSPAAASFPPRLRVAARSARQDKVVRRARSRGPSRSRVRRRSARRPRPAPGDRPQPAGVRVRQARGGPLQRQGVRPPATVAGDLLRGAGRPRGCPAP